MSRCREYQDAIVELVEGELNPAAQRDLERHVESCTACRALIADLKSIQAAAFTLDRHPLPGHLLPQLQARLASEPAPAQDSWVSMRQLRTSAPWLAVAATLVVVIASSLWILRSGQLSPEGPTDDSAVVTSSAEAVASVQAELQAATEHYERAIQQLEQIARTDNGALDPQVAAVFQNNLQVIDQAIDESRVALQAQPTSENVQEGLFDAMRSKVALLQQTVELINEMRKGNQAEAGRLLQEVVGR